MLSQDREWAYVISEQDNPSGKLQVYSAETGSLVRTVEIAPGNSKVTLWDLDLSPSGTLYALQGRDSDIRLIRLSAPEAKSKFQILPLDFKFDGYTDVIHLSHGDDGRMRVLAKDSKGEPTYLFFRIDDTRSPPEVVLEKTLSLSELKKQIARALQLLQDADDANGTNSLKELLDRAANDVNPYSKDPLRAPTDPNGSCPPPEPYVGSPKLVDLMKESLKASFLVMGGPCGTNTDVAVSLDLKPGRDALINSGWLKREKRDLGTFAIDTGLGLTWDVVGGVLEYVILKLAGEDTQWQGMARLFSEVKERGIGAWRIDGIAWKDSNFASSVNLLHGFPFFLHTSFLRARGYSELEAFIGGTIAQAVLHEFGYEPWEQGKSGHDLLLNELGVIAGAFFHVGNQIEKSLFTGLLTNKFYYDDGPRRYSIGFEQISVAKGTPVEDMPVRPWNLRFGVEYTPNEAKWITLGAVVNLLTDQNNKTSFFDTFSIGRTQVGLSCQVRVP